MFQVNEPSLGVAAVISASNTPALYRSIFTSPLISSVQVIFCDVLVSQFSLPFGVTTVKSLFIIVKSASDRSNTPASSALIIFIL